MYYIHFIYVYYTCPYLFYDDVVVVSFFFSVSYHHLCYYIYIYIYEHALSVFPQVQVHHPPLHLPLLCYAHLNIKHILNKIRLILTCIIIIVPFLLVIKYNIIPTLIRQMSNISTQPTRSSRR